MMSAAPNLRAPTVFLPGSAYFAQGAGPACDQLRRDLGNNGFTKITGPGSSQRGPRALDRAARRPARPDLAPGTTSPQPYDIQSAIVIVGV